MPNTTALELVSFSVAGLADKLRTRQISPVELADAYLDRIEQLDRRIGAYITVTPDTARDAAKLAEREIMAGNWRGPFHGVPVALKDLCYTKGIRTTAGSKILADFVPDYDSTVWARLAAAGAILLGKLNTHEFASGATTTNPHWSICRNPYNLDRIPGGSSGGSGAAIVAKMAAATIGTDTGGSIRIPAAFCGCVGMKQTWSRVSRFGVVPLSDSLDHAGPITRTVRDAALMLGVIAGHDPNDSTSSHEPVPDYCESLGKSIKGLRIGVVKELCTQISEQVWADFDAALDQFRALGARIEEVSIPSVAHTLTIVSNIMLPEAYEAHRQWLQNQPADYSDEVRNMMEAGMLLPASLYVRAQRARAVMLSQALDALGGCSVLAAPTAAITAPLIDRGARALLPDGNVADLADAVMRLCSPFNATGQPALALPTGIASDGLPSSMQIIGKPFDECTVFQVAGAYEDARGLLPEPKL